MEKYLSLAYQSTVKFPNEKHYESIDLLSSDVSEVSLNNYPNLQRIRISKCPYLKKVHLSKMPKLQVVDLLNNDELQSVTFEQCPSIITVDAGFSTKLNEIKGIDNIEYLSVPYCYYLNLPRFTKLVFLDISSVSCKNIIKLIQENPKLECLICTYGSTLNLSEITKNHSLQILQISSATINLDSIDKRSQLKIIIFDNCEDYEERVEGDKSLLDKFYVTDSINSNKDLNNFTRFDDFIPEYQKYQTMLYGPWGVPKIDLKKPVEVESPVVKPPDGVDHEKAADAIVGSIMASAAFDMIGVGVEFINESVSKVLLLGKMSIAWSHPRCNRHNQRFVRGTPTDDTSQCVLIMRSIVESNKQKKDDDYDDILSSDSENEKATDDENLSLPITVDNVRIDPRIFSSMLVDWIEHGHAEHKHDGGLGCGSTTFNVVTHYKYNSDPIFAAKDVWKSGGKKAAPNGSVMRIASSGCFAFWNEEIVVKTAEKYAKVTHADPRCIFASIAAAILIARYIQWNAGIRGDKEPVIDDALRDAKKFVPEIEKYKSDIDFYSNCKNVEELKLSDEDKIGYCLKAFGSGVWALRYCKSFDEGLVKVLREGGDADTNGAVVGALLGAKFGFKKLPKELVDYMFVGQWMFREMAPYMKLMGIEMLPSPYIKE